VLVAAGAVVWPANSLIGFFVILGALASLVGLYAITSMARRRTTVIVLALIAGVGLFFVGLAAAIALFGVEGTPRRQLWELNASVSVAVVYLGLGGILVVQAASALGGSGSTVLRLPPLRLLFVAAPVMLAAIVLGHLIVSHPESNGRWAFPVVNLVIVAVPSIAFASLVTARYRRANPLSWPISWREWTTGFTYGAIGATTMGGIVNSLYLAGMGEFLVEHHGTDFGGPLIDSLRTLPRGWGLFLDLTVLSVVAPLNEEFWKGMLVGFFLFRRGRAARCFLWGVLAGSGFNLLETFGGSVGILDPDGVSQQQLNEQWWLFASARTGTALIHGLASGLSALGFYGLLTRRWRYLAGYPLGVLVHGSWNFLTYVVEGDAMFSQAGPDSALLDVAGIAGLIVLACACAIALWALAGRLSDGAPAPIYRALGMLPAPPLSVPLE